MAAQARDRPERPAAEAEDAEDALRSVVAQRLREYRSDLDWTLNQLAGRSGVSKAMLSKIENAQTTPTLSTLARLGSALSVPVTAFFRGLDEEHDLLHVKAGQGLEIQHRGSSAGQRYQLLGRMRFPHDRLEPTLVTIATTPPSSSATSLRATDAPTARCVNRIWKWLELLARHVSSVGRPVPHATR